MSGRGRNTGYLVGIPQITSIYPNPVQDYRLNITFSHPVDGEVSYTILDLTGKVVQFEELNSNGLTQLELHVSRRYCSRYLFNKNKEQVYTPSVLRLIGRLVIILKKNFSRSPPPPFPYKYNRCHKSHRVRCGS